MAIDKYKIVQSLFQNKQEVIIQECKTLIDFANKEIIDNKYKDIAEAILTGFEIVSMQEREEKMIMAWKFCHTVDEEQFTLDFIKDDLEKRDDSSISDLYSNIGSFNSHIMSSCDLAIKIA
jgi:hypothetical protein